MQIVSALKGLGIMTSNAVTDLFDPYRKFTRPAEVKDASPLHEKAQRFQAIIDSSFHLRDGTIMNYRIPLPVGSPFDIGDQALWHGVYTASSALEYHLRSTEDKRLKLAGYVDGLADQQPDGMLIRGIDDSGRTEANASNDSACGHLAGLFFAHRYGDHSNDQRLAEVIHQWAQAIIKHGYALHNADGKPTQYGALDQGWKTDPLRMTLLLAILLTAYQITRSTEYMKRYNELKWKHYLMLAFPKARFFTIEKHPDTHRAAIQLHILAELDPQESVYKYGLRKLMAYARKSGNVWIMALCGRHVGYAEGDRSLALKVLSEFTVEDKGDNTGKQLSLDPTVPKVRWGGQWVTRQPFPVHRRTSQDFYFSRHPWSTDGRTQGEPPDSLLNGGDFLAAWRLGQVTGLFQEND